MGDDPGIGNSVYLSIGPVRIQLCIKYIQNGFIMDSFQLQICLCKCVAVFNLSWLRPFIELLIFVIVNHLFQTVNDSLVVFFCFVHRSYSVQMSHPRNNALAEGHVDKTDELFPVILNVEVKESNQKIMHSEDACTDS